jgi:hypothetical protein
MKTLSRHLPEGIQEEQNISLSIIGTLAEIRAGRLLNMNLNHYRYASLLGVIF